MKNQAVRKEQGMRGLLDSELRFPKVSWFRCFGRTQPSLTRRPWRGKDFPGHPCPGIADFKGYLRKSKLLESRNPRIPCSLRTAFFALRRFRVMPSVLVLAEMLSGNLRLGWKRFTGVGISFGVRVRSGQEIRSRREAVVRGLRDAGT